MTRAFKPRGEEDWKPPRPVLPRLQPMPLATGASPARRPQQPHVEVSAVPGSILLTAKAADGEVIIESACDVATRTVRIGAVENVLAQARWTGSSFTDLRWQRDPTQAELAANLLIEEALVRAWSDPEVRRASYTSPVEAVALGVRPDHRLPDARLLGRELGDLHEHEALGLVRRAMERHGWAQSARRATPEEDAEGKDIVVETDAGDLYVQVKSSPDAISAWRRKHGATLGTRAIVIAWQGDRPPTVDRIAADLGRAYRSTFVGSDTPSKPAAQVARPRRPQVAPAPEVTEVSDEAKRLLNELPTGIRCLFDAAGQPLKGRGTPYLTALVQAYGLALERDREKTERTRISAELDRDRNRLRDALRLVVRTLRSMSAAEAATLLEALAAIDPWFLDDRFVQYQPPPNDEASQP